MRQALKRWLIKCAAGTTLTVGGVIFTLPLGIGSNSMPLVSLEIPLARADETPATTPVAPSQGSPGTPAPLPPGETGHIYTVNSIPIVGSEPIIVDQVIVPVTVPIAPVTPLNGTGGINTQPQNLPVAAPGSSVPPPIATLGIIPAEISSGPAKPNSPSFHPVPDHRPVSPVGLQIEFPRGVNTPPRKAFMDLSAAPCFAHSADYTWIAGRVEYSNIQKEWQLRYTSVDEVDRFGGRVTLIENQHLQYLKDGMYLQVRGHLVNPDNPKNDQAFYRIEWFQRIDNPNQVVQPSPDAKSIPTTPKGSPTPSVPAVIPASTNPVAPDSSLTLPAIPLNLTPTSTNPNTLPLLPNAK